MAIRIKDGDLPKSGRLTMPRGTYLSSQAPFSNPATAASGQLGGFGGGLPPTPQILPGTPGYMAEKQYQQPKSAWEIWFPKPNLAPIQPGTADWNVKLLVDKIQRGFGLATGAIPFVTPNSSGSPDERDAMTNALAARNTTNAFKTPEVKQNDFVGKDIGGYPAQLSLSQLKSMLPGNPSFESVNALMQSKGYSYIPYGGGFFAKTGQAAPASQQPSAGVGTATSGELDARGRPQYVDPTQLARGERVTAASGVTFVGGQDYTNPAGETVSQYAVTIPGKGDRWKSSIKQDKEGNWVKVYYQTYGKANTKRGRRLRAQRAEREAEQQAAVQQVAPAVESPVSTQQLVNLRAAYG